MLLFRPLPSHNLTTASGPTVLVNASWSMLWDQSSFLLWSHHTCPCLRAEDTYNQSLPSHCSNHVFPLFPFKHFHNSLPVTSCKSQNFGQYLLTLSYIPSQEAVGFYHKNTFQVYLQRCYLLFPQTPFKISLGLQSGNEETTGITVKATCVNKTALQFTFAITCSIFSVWYPLQRELDPNPSFTWWWCNIDRNNYLNMRVSFKTATPMTDFLSIH